ncbi:MAG TPA: hypothetical protein VES97_12985 [Solirubrobacteraceae bacterium]|nr:hypothetical protein [Solirubrobacteraceae bacterium]
MALTGWPTPPVGVVPVAVLLLVTVLALDPLVLDPPPHALSSAIAAIAIDVATILAIGEPYSICPLEPTSRPSRCASRINDTPHRRVRLLF